MTLVSDGVLIELWERASSEHPLDRAITLIGLCKQNAGSRRQLAELSISERDTRLYRVVGDLIGRQPTLVATCKACSAETELILDLSAIDSIAERSESNGSFAHSGQRLAYRMPNSRDLANALNKNDPEEARRALLRSLLGSSGAPVAALSALEKELANRAGLEALTIRFQCSECGLAHASLFDVVDYLWRCVDARAKRALRDVHVLATAYGWTSGEILALSPARRAAHIAMVNQ